MLTCPLLKAECIKEQCNWWVVNSKETNKCVLPILNSKFTDAVQSLELIQNELSDQ
jgi:hypothetical protein